MDVIPPQEAKAREWFLSLSDDQLGKFGETFLGKILASAGLHYISLCRIEEFGRGPRTNGKGKPMVLPDIETINPELSVFIDSKVKTTSVIFRKANNQERHGIDRTAYDEYKKVSDLAGKKCGISVVELQRELDNGDRQWSGTLLIESLAELGPYIPAMQETNQRHMIYWPRKSFRDLESFSAMSLYEIAHDKKSPASFYNELRQIFFPQKQKPLF